MTGNFFDRLELELGDLTRAGAHLDGTAARRRRRMATLLRRGVVVVALAVALATSLAGEFPAAASGQGLVARASVGHDL